MSHIPPQPTFIKLIIHSLLHYRWMTLAIILGVMIGTASLTGALVIGDSVRGSLKEMTLLRLGNVDSAIVAPRFFREDLAQEIDQSFHESHETSVKVLPALTLQGSLIKTKDQQTARVNQVNIFGVQEEFLNFSAGQKSDNQLQLKDNQLILSSHVAAELGANIGDQLSILLEIPSAIPRDTLLGEREEITQEIIVKVSDILNDEDHLSRFSLTPNQRLPYNSYVSLSYLQEQLKLQKVERSKRNPVEKPARVNSLFLLNSKPEPTPSERWAELLQQKVSHHLELADLDLRLIAHESQQYVSLESNRLLLENNCLKALDLVKVSSPQKIVTDTAYVYLINEFSNLQDDKKFSMYSVMGGLNFPLHRLENAVVDLEGNPLKSPGKDEVILTDWLAEDLGVKVGDEIKCKYHLIGSHGELPEEVVTFKVAQIFKLEGNALADRGLVPEVEGFTNVESLQDLDQPFPMNLDRVTNRDDEYWEKYRATPKAYISLEKARELWQSRYGQQTSVQIKIPENVKFEVFSRSLTQDLLKNIDLQETGLVVQALRKTGLDAARGSNDFSGLFLGFSMFLIMGALLLVSMLYRLNIEQRANQVGLMQALGLTPGKILYLFGGESLVTVIAGAALGIIASILYAAFIIYALTTWWKGAVGTTDLNLHLSIITCITGFLISVLLCMVVIYFSLRALKQYSPRELIHGDWREAETTNQKPSWLYRQRYNILIGSLIIIVVSLLGIIPQTEAVAGLAWTVFSFFISGIGLLTAGILIAQDILAGSVLNILKHRGSVGVLALAARNTTRQMTRSLISISLVAIATYLVIAVAVGKYNPTKIEPERSSGNGGFRLVAESTQPILPDWNTTEGKKDLRMNLEEKTSGILISSQTYRFLKKAGEDASCLNLYQTQLPTILGVPQSFIERGGFAFAQTPGKNPWDVLNEKLSDQLIPVIGDMNTLQFSLHKGPGSTIKLSNAAIPNTEAKVSGMLTGSVFQGVLLMSEENFRKIYPEVSGANYFLIEVSAQDEAALTTLLETKLTDYGLDVETVAERQREFLAVQNTYLSTFQSLGGFGLLLGTIGVAIVMLRNVLERRKEYALMQSLGFFPSYISSLILYENGVIIGYGLFIGTLAAIISMYPHVSQSGADVPWRDVILLLGLIFSVGILSGFYAARVAREGNIVETLRN